MWTLTGCGHTILGPVAIALLLVVLTFILRDAWLLLGIPAAFVGTAAGAPSSVPAVRQLVRQSDGDVREYLMKEYRSVRRARLIANSFVAAAVVGLVFGWFAIGWRSPFFLISCAFLVPFATNVSYHAICQRAFLRLLVTSEDFYEHACSRNIITLKETGSG